VERDEEGHGLTVGTVWVLEFRDQLVQAALQLPRLACGRRVRRTAGPVGHPLEPIYNVNQLSLRQAICPERLLGRMNATMRFLVWGTMPIGGLLAGGLATAIGPRSALWVAAVGGSLGFLWILGGPVRRVRDIPEPELDPLDSLVAAGRAPGSSTPG
jgi:hypothetical protein